MKKVGIITVHKNTNYGANLQAFASCQYIKSLGYDCNIIDYILPEHDRANHLLSWLRLSWDGEKNKSISRKLKLGGALLLSAPEKYMRLRRFSDFWKHGYSLSPSCNSMFDIVKLNYDAVVCGSDQIWNPDIMGGINPVYFGDISGVENRISYAASIGKEAYDSFYEKQAVKLIENLDYCSLREEKSARYISDLTGRNAKCVCDPVFLPDREVFEKLASKRISKSKYILVYSVVSNPAMVNAATKYAEEKGLKLIEICASKNKRSKHTQITSFGPKEFLSAIKGAEVVFTNSFHGTAFAIIFEKNLFCFDNKERGSRITNLLEKAGLTDRLVDENAVLTDEVCDYESLRNNLESYIKESKEFLETALRAEHRRLAEERCTGCGACRAICKKDAIKVRKDREGFFRSYINEEICINCGACQKVCPQLNDSTKKLYKKVLAFKAEDELRIRSASGGAFAALAKTVLQKGGVVWGAAENETFCIEHIKCEKQAFLKALQGTKYVQSDMGKCYESIEEDLKMGKTVLFSGTPCQVDGIRNFAKIKNISDNLYLVDIICHGIPSSDFYQNFIEWLENELKHKIKKYCFRSKEISWRGNSCVAVLDNGSVLKNNKRALAYMNVYYSGNITNKACYGCRYATEDRVSDLTISDYWGIENVKPEFEDKLGVSMILVNTDKGEMLLSKLCGQLENGDVTEAKQPQLHHAVEKPALRKEFWKNYKIRGIDYVVKKFGGVSKTSMKTRVYNFIKMLRRR